MHHPHTIGRRCFTLVEILVSLAVLSLLMFMLLQILMRAQQSVRHTTSQTLIYENSRIAIDILERDLRSALTSSVPGREMGFYIANPDPTDEDRALQFTIVSSTTTPANATSQLAEISYAFHTDRGATGGLRPFTLYRQVTSNLDDTNWNFTGRPTNWFLNNRADANLARFEEVVSGVSSLAIRCYDEGNVALPVDLDTTTMPTRIEIMITLFDETLTEAKEEERFRTQRTYAKILRPGDLRSF
jgi:prepilin-type N-terminal cleavage/methylation domain-containing protein